MFKKLSFTIITAFIMMFCFMNCSKEQSQKNANDTLNLPTQPATLGQFPNGELAPWLISKELFGFNGGMMFIPNPAFSKDEGVKLYSQMPDKVLRFPGGTVANCYHVFNRNSKIEAPGYGFIRDENEAPVCSSASMYSLYKQQLDPQSVNILNTFIDHIKKTKGSVIYVPNLLSGTQAEYEYVLNKFKENNIEVLGIELGNELYFNQYRNTTTSYGCKDEVDYIYRYARPAAQFFKNKFPQLKISFIVPGNFEDPNLDTTGSWKENWLIAMANEARAYPNLYDAYSIHGYFDAPACEKYKADYKNLATCAYNAISSHKNNVMKNIREFFTTRLPINLEAWITEWNLNTSSSTSAVRPIVNTLAHGCIAQEFLIDMIKNNDWLKHSSFHSYSAGAIGAGAVFIKKSGTENMNGGDQVTAAVTYYAHLFSSQAAVEKAQIIKSVVPQLESSMMPSNIPHVATRKQNGEIVTLFSNCSTESIQIRNDTGLKMKKISYVYGNHLYDSAGGAGYSAQDVSLELNQKTQFKSIETGFDPVLITIPAYSYGVLVQQ